MWRTGRQQLKNNRKNTSIPNAKANSAYKLEYFNELEK